MKVIITSKNIKTNNYLKETIEKKLEKLSKYFADDIEVNVMLSSEKKFEKMEATIRVKEDTIVIVDRRQAIKRRQIGRASCRERV